jgi:hypothetical protein
MSGLSSYTPQEHPDFNHDLFSEALFVELILLGLSQT